MKIILKEFFGPIDLSRAQTFYIYKITKIVIVYENKNLMLIAFQGMTPYFKGFDNN